MRREPDMVPAWAAEASEAANWKAVLSCRRKPEAHTPEELEESRIVIARCIRFHMMRSAHARLVATRDHHRAHSRAATQYLTEWCEAAGVPVRLVRDGTSILDEVPQWR